VDTKGLAFGHAISGSVTLNAGDCSDKFTGYHVKRGVNVGD
jgi:hypothetical protein